MIGRLAPGNDLLKSIEGLARERGLETATFQCLGAVRNAKLAFYDQEAKEYEEFAVDEPMEMIICHGNVSLKEGQPFVHAHASLSDSQGGTVSGHVLPGTEVF
ncbi:MAG: PPC domain-containing DNA-binding protein, partial [Anaerolineae bacterium]